MGRGWKRASRKSGTAPVPYPTTVLPRVKHALKIRHFFGTCENAVQIQIAIALIAFLLLRAAHAIQNSVQSLLTFTRLIANNLMHRRPLDRLLEQPPPSIQNARQLSLNLCQI